MNFYKMFFGEKEEEESTKKSEGLISKLKKQMKTGVSFYDNGNKIASKAVSENMKSSDIKNITMRAEEILIENWENPNYPFSRISLFDYQELSQEAKDAYVNRLTEEQKIRPMSNFTSSPEPPRAVRRDAGIRIERQSISSDPKIPPAYSQGVDIDAEPAVRDKQMDDFVKAKTIAGVSINMNNLKKWLGDANVTATIQTEAKKLLPPPLHTDEEIIINFYELSDELATKALLEKYGEFDVQKQSVEYKKLYNHYFQIIQNNKRKTDE